MPVDKEPCSNALLARNRGAEAVGEVEAGARCCHYMLWPLLTVLVGLAMHSFTLHLESEQVPPWIDYWGYRPASAPGTDGTTIECLSTAPPAETFMRDYVLPRRPVALRLADGLDAGLGWRTERWQQPHYLAEAVHQGSSGRCHSLTDIDCHS